MIIRTALVVLLIAMGVPFGRGPAPMYSDIPTEPSIEEIGFPAPNPPDEHIWQEKLPLATAEKDLAAQTLAIARSFLGTPYVHGTLDQAASEQLTVNLRELDCWTFVENSLGIALSARIPNPAYDTLQKYVQQLRYWGGMVNGYASRIHYFSGWLLQAEKLGYLRDITRELGGVPYRKHIGYMSARPQKYPPLRDPDARRVMTQVEERVSQHQWFYIPQHRVAQMEHLIQEGDIIALTSAKRDLDIAHQGFAVRRNGRVYLLHASSLGRRVILAAQPLAKYVLAQKGQTGIMVARLQ